MRKENTRQNKGITLVALIITIVVLLILAVVSIGAIKDSNIIKHSQTALSEYTIAQEKEKLQLAVDEWETAKNVPENAENLQRIIKSSLKKDIESGEVVKVDGNEDGSLTIIFKSGRKYSITKSGDIKEKNGETIDIVGKYGSDSGEDDWEYYEFFENGKGYSDSYGLSEEEKNFGSIEPYKSSISGRRNFTYFIESDNTGVMTFESGRKKNFLLAGTNENKVLLADYDDGAYYEAFTTNGTVGLTKIDNYSKTLKYYDDEGNVVGKAIIDGNAKTISLYIDGETEASYQMIIPNDAFILTNLEWTLSDGSSKVNECIFARDEDGGKNCFWAGCFVVNGDSYMDGGH